jgi:hypothetical protein
MTQIEILDDSVSWPLAIPIGRSNYDGVPSAVATFSADIEPWQLIGWRDPISNTIGVARKHQAITLSINSVDAISISFMQRAKGPGFVSLEAKIQGSHRPVILFEVVHFDEDALRWLRDRMQQLEILFGIPISVNDRGSDY